MLFFAQGIPHPVIAVRYLRPPLSFAFFWARKLPVLETLELSPPSHRLFFFSASRPAVRCAILPPLPELSRTDCSVWAFYVQDWYPFPVRLSQFYHPQLFSFGVQVRPSHVCSFRLLSLPTYLQASWASTTPLFFPHLGFENLSAFFFHLNGFSPEVQPPRFSCTGNSKL